MVSLRAKGVIPVKSQSAVLSGWRLRFNVAHFFRNEGGVANIEYSGDANDQVLGVIHECSDEALAPLDATEAYGYGYDRITVAVEVYDDTNKQAKTFSALTYVGMPNFIDNNCLPSRRYLNILLDGSIQAGLDQAYIAKLKAQPVHTPKEYPTFIPPQGEHPVFDVNSLKGQPLYTALLGYVFDMAEARPHHQYLKGYFGGKDMTLFHLQRLDSSDNQETISDIKDNLLNFAQLKYLNSFLVEYAVEYKFVGHFTYHHE